jgi:hypothetical protein
MRDRLERQLKHVLKKQKNWLKDHGELPEGIDWTK